MSLEHDCLPGANPVALQRTVEVVANEPMGTDTWRLRVRCPEMARTVLPGQFFMFREALGSDPLLGRPFALFATYSNAAGEPQDIEIGYLVVGKLTSRLAQHRPGDTLELWGPLGTPFPVNRANHVLIIAGGIGQTPFLPVIQESLGVKTFGTPARQLTMQNPNITMRYGVRTASYLSGLAEFAAAGTTPQIATDDGSQGHRGYVTDLLDQMLATGDRPDQLLCCGPEPLMRAVRQRAKKYNLPCLLSLESPMACGFGACFSCVTPVRQPSGGWDYRRICVEGPIFPAADVLLDAEELNPTTCVPA